MISLDPTIALLNWKILMIAKHLQALTFYILLGVKIMLARAWKPPTISFRAAKRKISWIMLQEHLVAKLQDKFGKFEAIWEPWASYCNISLCPSLPNR